MSKIEKDKAILQEQERKGQLPLSETYPRIRYRGKFIVDPAGYAELVFYRPIRFRSFELARRNNKIKSLRLQHLSYQDVAQKLALEIKLVGQVGRSFTWVGDLETGQKEKSLSGTLRKNRRNIA